MNASSKSLYQKAHRDYYRNNLAWKSLKTVEFDIDIHDIPIEPDLREVEMYFYRKYIEEALQMLGVNERRILTARCGLDTGQPKSLEDVGREMGTSRERVRQIENKALEKIRQSDVASKLSP